jgi:hypothetical protein
VWVGVNVEFGAQFMFMPAGVGHAGWAGQVIVGQPAETSSGISRLSVANLLGATVFSKASHCVKSKLSFTDTQKKSLGL